MRMREIAPFSIASDLKREQVGKHARQVTPRAEHASLAHRAPWHRYVTGIRTRRRDGLTSTEVTRVRRLAPVRPCFAAAAAITTADAAAVLLPHQIVEAPPTPATLTGLLTLFPRRPRADRAATPTSFGVDATTRVDVDVMTRQFDHAHRRT